MLVHASACLGLGANHLSELGLKRPKLLTKPAVVPLPAFESVAKVCCGAHFSLFLCESGRVYGCGSNNHCQLGLKYSITTRFLEQPTLIATGMVDIAAGSDHSLFVARDGAVYSCGALEDGQTGKGFELQRSLSRTLISGASRCFAGDQSSAVLRCRSDAAGARSELFVFGSNLFGQLSVRYDVFQPTSVSVPKRVELPTVFEVADVHLCTRYMLIRGTCGRVLSAGAFFLSPAAAASRPFPASHGSATGPLTVVDDTFAVLPLECPVVKIVCSSSFALFLSRKADSGEQAIHVIGDLPALGIRSPSALVRVSATEGCPSPRLSLLQQLEACVDIHVSRNGQLLFGVTANGCLLKNAGLSVKYFDEFHVLAVRGGDGFFIMQTGFAVRRRCPALSLCRDVDVHAASVFPMVDVNGVSLASGKVACAVSPVIAMLCREQSAAAAAVAVAVSHADESCEDACGCCPIVAVHVKLENCSARSLAVIVRYLSTMDEMFVRQRLGVLASAGSAVRYVVPGTTVQIDPANALEVLVQADLLRMPLLKEICEDVTIGYLASTRRRLDAAQSRDLMLLAVRMRCSNILRYLEFMGRKHGGAMHKLSAALWDLPVGDPAAITNSSASHAAAADAGRISAVVGRRGMGVAARIFGKGMRRPSHELFRV